MKTYKKLQNILTMVAVLITCFSFGQAQTEYINYQGVARDASNEIFVNQAISIGISLRFGSPSATVLYSENHTVTTDLSGVFSLQIGTGTVNSGIYKDLQWGKLAPYATITLNGTAVGTVALQSVPYANSSGKAVNMKLNDLTDVEGTPKYNHFLKWNGTSWVPDDVPVSSSLWKISADNIYYNTGNVGIGNTSPKAKLDIAGGQWDLNNTEGDLRIGNNTYRLKMGMSTGGGGAGRAHIQAQGGINEIVLGTGSKEVLKIKEDAIVVDGEVNRPSTGTANMLPFAYGTILSNGEIRNGSGNFTLIKSLRDYNITFAGEEVNPENTTILITSQDGLGDYYIFSERSQIRVRIIDEMGFSIGGGFSFLIYKQ